MSGSSAETDFTEPWQAEALALSIALQEAGYITPTEWSETLADEIGKARASGDSAYGITYELCFDVKSFGVETGPFNGHVDGHLCARSRHRERRHRSAL